MFRVNTRLSGLVLFAVASFVIPDIGAAAPTPSMIERLQPPVIGHRWTRISTSRLRFDARVGRLDARGLGQFEMREPGTPVPDALSWNEITRIDALQSRAMRGTVLGASSAALAAGILSGIGGFAASSGPATLVPIYAAAIAGGGYVGRRIGRRQEHESLLYWPDSPPAPAGMPTPVAALPPVAGDFSLGPGVPDAETLDGVAAIVRPGHRIRITRPDQLRASGYAVGVSERGIHGFVPDEASEANPVAPTLIPWSQIQRLDRRGNNAGRGALITGGTFGALGAMIGAAAVAAFGDGGGADVAGGAGVGFAVAGGFGALLGAAFGAAVPAWHQFY